MQILKVSISYQFYFPLDVFNMALYKKMCLKETVQECFGHSKKQAPDTK